MIKKINNFLKKEIVILIFLIFLPLLNFINPNNLKQLPFISLWPLFLFSIIVCLLLILILIFKNSK